MLMPKILYHPELRVLCQYKTIVEQNRETKTKTKVDNTSLLEVTCYLRFKTNQQSCMRMTLDLYTCNGQNKDLSINQTIAIKSIKTITKQQQIA